MKRPVLYGAPGGGSMIVEAAAGRCGLALDFVDLSWDEDWAAGPLAAVNPLLQVPTLALPGGQIITESAAIILLLAEQHPEAALAPAPTEPERRAFLRWLLFLNAAVYPTFTYGDIPARFVEGDEAAGEKLRRATDRRREQLYAQLEDNAGAPWFLGARFSAIDLYLWVMVNWRPRRAWFERTTPKLFAAAAKAGALEECRAALDRNGGVLPPP